MEDYINLLFSQVSWCYGPAHGTTVSNELEGQVLDIDIMLNRILDATIQLTVGKQLITCFFLIHHSFRKPEHNNLDVNSLGTRDAYS